MVYAIFYASIYACNLYLVSIHLQYFPNFQMDTGTSQEEPCVSPKNVSLFTSSERFKYSLDNPLTLKSLSNIRAILDQHTNFLMGLAATSSLSLKSDLSHLSTIPTLFILQRLFIPLKIYHDLPEIPVVKGKYTTKPEAKKELAEKSMFEWHRTLKTALINQLIAFMI